MRPPPMDRRPLSRPPENSGSAWPAGGRPWGRVGGRAHTEGRKDMRGINNPAISFPPQYANPLALVSRIALCVHFGSIRDGMGWGLGVRAHGHFGLGPGSPDPVLVSPRTGSSALQDGRVLLQPARELWPWAAVVRGRSRPTFAEVLPPQTVAAPTGSKPKLAEVLPLRVAARKPKLWSTGRLSTGACWPVLCGRSGTYPATRGSLGSLTMSSSASGTNTLRVCIGR